MVEYIDREKIGLSDFEIAMCNGDYKEGMKMLLDKIESIPAADVRPVVLCRDCKYYFKDAEGYEMCENSEGYDYVTEDGFCAWAKKREES